MGSPRDCKQQQEPAPCSHTMPQPSACCPSVLRLESDPLLQKFTPLEYHASLERRAKFARRLKTAMMQAQFSLALGPLLVLIHAIAAAGNSGHDRLRGGSTSAASAASPLKSFIRHHSPLARHCLSSAGQGNLPNPKMPAERTEERRVPDVAVLDAEGDSLMGAPAEACSSYAVGSKNGAEETEQRNAAPGGTAAVERRMHMISSAAEAAGSGKTCPWGGQDAVPFKYVCQHLTEAAAHDEQHLVTHLAQLVIDIWQHAPADLVSLVCLVRDQILSPTLEGVELLPAAALAKVVADSFAKTSEGLRKALSAADGDLAATASKLRCSQRTLFPTPPLALAQVVEKLRDVAERRDMIERLSGAKALLVASGSQETSVLVKALEGGVRFLGFSKHVVISALAKAAGTMAPSRPVAEILLRQGEPAMFAQACGAGSAGDTDADRVGVLWQTVSLVPDWRKVVPALREHGTHGILAALRVPTPRTGRPARGAKVRALQRAETLEGSDWIGGLQATRTREEAAVEIAREQRYAAVTCGLNAHKLSRMEMECLAALLKVSDPVARDIRLRRLVVLRNEMLRRQRSKFEEGGMEGPWFLSQAEATAGLCGEGSARDVDDAAVVYQVLTLLGILNPAADILQPVPSRVGPDRVGGEAGTRRKVVVVGGGFAGVTAARRLRGWGYDVLVLEAQNRSGGRTWSAPLPPLANASGSEGQGRVVDLGGMVVTGTQGNPLVSVARSYGVPLRALRETCHLYAENGSRVDAALDVAAEELFNTLLDGAPAIGGRGAKARAQGKNLVDHQRAPPITHAGASLSSEPAPAAPASGCGGRQADTTKSLAAAIWSALKGFRESLLAVRRESPGPAAQTPPLEGGRVQAESRALMLEAEGGCGGIARGIRARAGAPRDLLDYGIIMAGETDGASAAVSANAPQSTQWTMEKLSAAESLLQWHCANLEYALGAPLESVSAEWWNFDDACAYAGPHWMLPGGFASLLAPLQVCSLPGSAPALFSLRVCLFFWTLSVFATSLTAALQPQRDIEMVLGAAVTRIDYSSQDNSGQQASCPPPVSVSYWHAGVETVIECDAVVVCVPLGVLKACVESDSLEAADEQRSGSNCGDGDAGAVEDVLKRAQSATARMGRIQFEPELPESKVEVIRAMGFGLLNKVVLSFDDAFWHAQEGDTDFFGVVPPLLAAGTEEERGRCRGTGFMFWSVGGDERAGNGDGGGSLLALMAGNAAQDVEDMVDEEVADAAMRALRQVWGTGVPEPVDFTVTRWRENPYVRGAYSYLPPDAAAPHDIEELVRPLRQRVFFAGEHTSASHPAQVSGALLSGLRAAGQVQFALDAACTLPEDHGGARVLSARVLAEAAAAEGERDARDARRRRAMGGDAGERDSSSQTRD